LSRALRRKRLFSATSRLFPSSFTLKIITWR